MIIQDFTNKLFCGDCIDIMKQIPDSSIDLVVTSPPYDKIRDYKGFNLDLNKIGIEIGRILKDGGICVMVIQDQTKNFRKSLTSFKTIVSWCKNTEMDLFECCIYYRSGAPGAWWNKRFRVDHEYIPIFLKGKRPQYFTKEHMKIKAKHGGETHTQSKRLTSGKTTKVKPVLINFLKGCGTIINYTSASRKTDKIKKQHPATFPDKLAEDFIKCFCPENGIVLDPMCGSGTTCKMAKLNNRKFIGIEMSEEYCKIAKERLKC